MNAIISTIISIFAITSFSAAGLEGARHMNDSIRGAFLGSIERLDPINGGASITGKGTTGRHRKTYGSLPAGLYRAGSLLMYRAENESSLRGIAEETIRFTDFYTLGEMTEAIKQANGMKVDRIAAGEVILIPGPLPVLIPDYAANRKRSLVKIKGLYITGRTAGGGSFPGLVKKMKDYGINAVVFDAKDITGIVNYRSGLGTVNRLNTHGKRTIHNIGGMLRLLKENGIYAIARLAVFQDHLLADKEPSFAIRSGRSGGIWNEGEKEIWLDPTNKEVQKYVMDLSMELLDLGVDEIQFDYIRFPTAGNQSDAVYSYDFGRMTRQQTITAFLEKSHRAIMAKNAILSIDIFGVVAWGKECDIKRTGQDIAMLAKNCDVISPMLYPSHFNDDFDGFTNPGDQPYHFIYQGCKKVMELSGGKTAVRPWLQAFRWRVSHYNADYIREQVKGSDESGAAGYLFWNSSNDYGNVWRAMKK